MFVSVCVNDNAGISRCACYSVCISASANASADARTSANRFKSKNICAVRHWISEKGKSKVAVTIAIVVDAVVAIDNIQSCFLDKG